MNLIFPSADLESRVVIAPANDSTSACWIEIEHVTPFLSLSANTRVHFGREDWLDFLVSLRECERTRRGETALRAMSPREFELRLWNTHSKGDFALAYTLERIILGTHSLKQSGAFELDAGRLLELLRNTETFVAEQARHESS